MLYRLSRTHPHTDMPLSLVNSPSVCSHAFLFNPNHSHYVAMLIAAEQVCVLIQLAVWPHSTPDHRSAHTQQSTPAKPCSFKQFIVKSVHFGGQGGVEKEDSFRLLEWNPHVLTCCSLRRILLVGGVKLRIHVVK